MALSFPRKFSDGYRVENADCYGDVYIYPSGHWLIGTHLSRAGGALSGTCVHVSFVLCDAEGLPLEAPGLNGVARFGMPSDHMWCVAPSWQGGPADRYDNISGGLPQEILGRAEKVSILFIHANKPFDWEAVKRTIKDIAQLGKELIGGGEPLGVDPNAADASGMYTEQ